jgi:hypothetical protein
MAPLSDHQPSDFDTDKASLWTRFRLWWVPGEGARHYPKSGHPSAGIVAGEISRAELDKSRSNQECVQSQVSR